jgi:hypothetical protein
MEEFIAHDWCGWNNNYGRYTHIPSGDTLVCKASMNQQQWDKIQLAFLSSYSGISVYECSGFYSTDNPSMGTVEEICERLRAKLKEAS